MTAKSGSGGLAVSARRIIGVLGAAATAIGAAVNLRAQSAAQGGSAADYAEGCRCLDARQCERAIESLARAVAARPDDREYGLKLCEAYLCAGKTDTARRLLENLRAATPDEPMVAVALARVHLIEGRHAATVDLLAPLESRLDEAGLLVFVDGLVRSGQPARAVLVARQGLVRFPKSEALWLVGIDHALSQSRGSLALQLVAAAREAMGNTGVLSQRAARAYLLLGKSLGEAVVRTVAGGQVGQIRDGWLLVDAREPEDSFLCSPRASALFELRRAIDTGLDDPETHCLHARIWQQAGFADRGFAMLREREAALLEQPDATVARTFLDAALASGELEHAARYAIRLAEVEPERRDRVLHDTYVQIAERYNQRGNEALYIEYLRRASELKPDDVALSLRLADAEWSADRRIEAARIYERLLREHPRLGGEQAILERLAETQAGGVRRP